LTRHAESVGLVTGLAIGCENLFAAIVRRKFHCLFCALWAGNFFHGVRLAAIWIKRFTAKVSGVTTEIGAAKEYRQSVNCNQPNRERFGANAGFALFALNGSVHLVDVGLFAVIHSLAHSECFRGWRFRFFVHCVVIFPALAILQLRDSVIRRLAEGPI
jgi:hypothetical protein